MAAAAGTPAGATGGPATAGAVPPQYLFNVITQQIKATINGLRSSIDDGDARAVNNAVIQAIEKLESLDKNINNINNINNVISLINKGNNNIHIDRQGKTSRHNNYGIDQNEKRNAYDFLINPETTSLTNNDGVRIAKLANGNTKKIDLNSLDSDQDINFNDGSMTDPTVLQPDYQFFDDSNEIEFTQTNANQIQNRLINCQYLEILYLTKHEELMKVFAFTLYLYDKYTYAIKILLFVLKNLLDRGDCPEPGTQPVPPGTPQPTGTTQAPKIRLPKALITNIKQLLKDQKQVQDVIQKMKTAVDDTVPNLVNPNMANAVKDLPTGNLMDETTPT